MSTHRIVIVDDDEWVRRLLRTTLSAEEYQIFEATDGDEGLRLVEEVSPDLVLLDWRMPGRHGSLVLDAVKEARPTHPVIVLTAEDRESQRELAESLRADAFLNKPFSPLELLGLIERLLGDRPANESP
jgi:two-component system alkaline phosphatase synthesis response regulator PhoP